jgi:hypothetical protein
MIVATAIAFALLPVVLAALFAVTAIGVLGIESLRLPVVTERSRIREWLYWSIWSVSLLICPFAISFIEAVYRHRGPLPPNMAQLDWASDMVGGFFVAHLCISVISSLAVVVLARGVDRLAAWAGVLIVGFYTMLATGSAVMSLAH